MKFRVRPIIDEMLAFYAEPISPDRFQKYLFKLQGGNKDQLSLPIMGYNPMAKEHVPKKLSELKILGAESIMTESLNTVNSSFNPSAELILVVLNLADDLKGAWTNRYSTDYNSKFKIGPLVKRNFCAPYFWTSETYSEALIEERLLQSVFRTVYAHENKATQSSPTLAECVEQEIFVSERVARISEGFKSDLNLDRSFFRKHQNSSDHSLIFNFFYGDAISELIHYPKYGSAGVEGYRI